MPLVIFCNSIQAAQILMTNHKTILRRIRNLHCSDEFREENFLETTYKDNRNRNHTLFLLTKSGLNLLLLNSGFRKSSQFRMALIQRFNKINEEVIRFIDDNNLTLTDFLGG